MKSVSDCLNFIDDATVENFSTLEELENIHSYLLEKRQNDYIENRSVLWNALCQIISKIENYDQFVEENKKSEYIQLRKLILVWLIEFNREPEVNDQK